MYSRDNAIRLWLRNSATSIKVQIACTCIAMKSNITLLSNCDALVTYLNKLYDCVKTTCVISLILYFGLLYCYVKLDIVYNLHYLNVE